MDSNDPIKSNKVQNVLKIEDLNNNHLAPDMFNMPRDQIQPHYDPFEQQFDEI